MAKRIKKALGGFQRPSYDVGRYRALDHTRVKGLDETEQFVENHKALQHTISTGDLSEGLSTVQFELLRTAQKFGVTVQTVALGPGM